MSQEETKPREFWWCDWCKDIYKKKSINGYCQECFEKKLQQLVPIEDVRELVEALERSICIHDTYDVNFEIQCLKCDTLANFRAKFPEVKL